MSLRRSTRRHNALMNNNEIDANIEQTRSSKRQKLTNDSYIEKPRAASTAYQPELKEDERGSKAQNASPDSSQNTQDNTANGGGHPYPATNLDIPEIPLDITSFTSAMIDEEIEKEASGGKLATPKKTPTTTMLFSRKPLLKISKLRPKIYKTLFF